MISPTVLDNKVVSYHGINPMPFIFLSMHLFHNTSKQFFLSKQIKQIGKLGLHVIQIVIKIDHISAICHCFYIKLHEIQRTKYIVCQK